MVQGTTQDERRRALLRRVARIVEADNYAVFGLVTDGDVLRYDRLVATGSGADLWCSARGRVFSGPWNPVRPQNGEAERFVVGEVPRRPIRDAFYEPLGLGTDLRMLVYDGDRFVAWLGLSRERGRPAFDEAEVAALNRHRESLAASLRAMSHLDRPGDGQVRGAFLTLCADGRIESASLVARRLLSRDLTAELGAAVRAGAQMPSVLAWSGLVVELVRLEGEDGERIVASLRPTSRVESALVRLTESQRAVTDLAVVGATVAEISRTLELSPHTVRQHLKDAYKRLDVGARVELVAHYQLADRLERATGLCA